jgi:hypothetical protein
MENKKEDRGKIEGKLKVNRQNIYEGKSICCKRG